MKVEGQCDSDFEPVRELFAANLDSGVDLGASLCVMRASHPAVDLWGGTASSETETPWGADTVCNTYSITKTMTALTALLLIDRGSLDPDAPVAEYWPEFAGAGKSQVLVRHVLGHSSGVCAWDSPVTIEDVYDQKHAANLLASQEPWWPPGEGSGYHVLTFGTIIGELVRRITGVSLGEFFAVEIAGPLSADYWIGAPEWLIEDGDRIAPMIPPPSTGPGLTALPAESIIRRTLTNPAFSPNITATPEFMRAELGAANGQGNARSVAKIQSIVAGQGQTGGHRLLSPRTASTLFEVQADGTDRVLGAPLRFGLGWALPCEAMPVLPDGRVAWWTGYGGAVLVADADRDLTIAYVPNKMSPELVGAPKALELVNAVYGAL